MGFHSGAGWAPVRLTWNHGAATVEWYRLGPVRFTEPFFEQTIAKCLSEARDGMPRRRTPMDELVEEQARRPGPCPSGFIFHMSRCGSTLVAQLLAALTDTLVISEAPPIDAVLRAHLHAPVSEERRMTWLRAMLGALGRASGGGGRYFVKFDAWSTMELPLIRRAFPDVPWIFVHREPEEVMVSHVRMRGSHMVPGVIEREVFGWAGGAPPMSLDEYGAAVLARICEAARAALDAGGPGRAVDYRDLPQALWTDLAEFFRLALTPEEVARMAAAAGMHAKDPSRAFRPDGREKRLEASAALRRIVTDPLRPAYDRLVETGRHSMRR